MWEGSSLPIRLSAACTHTQRFTSAFQQPAPVECTFCWCFLSAREGTGGKVTNLIPLHWWKELVGRESNCLSQNSGCLYNITLKYSVLGLLCSNTHMLGTAGISALKFHVKVYLPELFRDLCSWPLKARSNNFAKLNHVNKFYHFCNDGWDFFITCIINYASSRTQQNTKHLFMSTTVFSGE